jgi:hypothetical protein
MPQIFLYIYILLKNKLLGISRNIGFWKAPVFAVIRTTAVPCSNGPQQGKKGEDGRKKNNGGLFAVCLDFYGQDEYEGYA